MKFWLYDVFSRVENGVETAHLFGLDENNERVELVDSSVRPFLYAEKSALETCDGVVVVKKNGLNDEELVKIEGTDATIDIPQIVTFLKKQDIKTYNSDKYYTGVYMEERGFSPCAWHEISGHFYEIAPGLYEITEAVITQLEDYTVPDVSALALDIEVYNPVGGMPRIEKDPIILAGLLHRNANGEKTVAMLDAKGRYDDVLLGQLADGIKEFDPIFIVTYNGNEFDWDYIDKRSYFGGIKMRIALDGSRPHVTEYQTIAIHGRPTVDLYGIAKFVVPKGSRKTQPIVHAELKKAGLVPETTKYHEINRDLIARLWDNPKTRQEVVKHCRSDVEMTMDIFEYALGFMVELSRLTNLPPDEVFSVPYSILVEGFLMKVARDYGFVVPRAEFREQPHTSGAVNIEPKKGILENVAVFDFPQMYSNILIEKNISEETYVPYPDIVGVTEKDCHVVTSDTGEKLYFLKEPKGFFAIAMEILLKKIAEAKQRYKDRKYKQKYAGEVQALKTIARSMYGYLKSPKSRWHLTEAMEAVASEGRNRNTKAVEIAENYDQECVYGDTDSIFLTGLKRGEVEEFANILSEELGTEISFDKFYKILFFTEAKKIYAGIDEHGNTDYVGFTKSDWVDLANQAQKDILEIILKDRDPEKARQHVKLLEQGIKVGIFPLKKFIVWKKPHKSLQEYPEIGAIVKVRGKKKVVNPPAHVVVARRDPERFIEEDGTVGYVVVPGAIAREPLYKRARHYTEVNGVKDLDVEYYIKRQLYAVADRILKYFFEGGEKKGKYRYDYFKL